MVLSPNTYYGIGYVVCFAAILIFVDCGYRIGRKQRTIEGRHEAVSAMDAAVFAILGLLLAFSISTAADRLIERRDNSTEEANSVRTALLRTSHLPSETQAELSDKFREYVDLRIKFSSKIRSGDPTEDVVRQTRKLQKQIWNLASRHTDAASLNFVLPPMTTMFEHAETRTVDSETHTPTTVLVLICVLTLCAAFLAGRFSALSSSRIWIHWIVFSVTITAVIGTLFDLADPRIGFIHIEAADKVWHDLRSEFD